MSSPRRKSPTSRMSEDEPYTYYKSLHRRYTPSPNQIQMPIADFISGPMTLSVLQSVDHMKTIYLFGENHKTRDGCSYDKHFMFITEYIAQILLQQEVEMDLFVEASSGGMLPEYDNEKIFMLRHFLTKEESNPVTSYINEFSNVERLRALVLACKPTYSNRDDECNIGNNKVHWTDIRQDFRKTLALEKPVLDIEDVVQLESLLDMSKLILKEVKKIKVYKLLQRKIVDEINRTLKNILDLYYTQQRQRNTNKIITKLTKLMDVYTTARMMKSYAKNIIFYGGESHRKNIQELLVQSRQFQLVEYTSTNSMIDNCLDMSPITQPFFEI